MKTFIFCMLVTFSFWETKAQGDSCVTVATKDVPNFAFDLLNTTCFATGTGQINDKKEAIETFKNQYFSKFLDNPGCPLGKALGSDLTGTAEEITSAIANIAKSLAEASEAIGVSNDIVQLICNPEDCQQKILGKLKVTVDICKDEQSINEYIKELIKENCVKTLDDLSEQVVDAILKSILDNELTGIVKKLCGQVKLPALK